MRRVRRVLWAVVGVVVVLLACLRLAPASLVSAAAVPDGGTPLTPVPAPGFVLTDQYGQRRSLAQFRGRVVLLTFIDSECTTTCPLEAAMLQRMLRDLGPARAADVQLLAVNVNRGAAGVADVYRWSQAHGMNGRWLFLTGGPATLAGVWRSYHIAVSGSGSAVEHTSAIYLLDRGGRERRVWDLGDAAGGPGQALALAAQVADLLR